MDDMQLSEAIVAHLGLMWNVEMEGKIREAVGEQGLKKIKEIDEFANRPELWTTGDDGFKRVKLELAEKYPFLTAQAVTVVGSLRRVELAVRS